jgi:hypothetical protein
MPWVSPPFLNRYSDPMGSTLGSGAGVAELPALGGWPIGQVNCSSILRLAEKLAPPSTEAAKKSW